MRDSFYRAVAEDMGYSYDDDFVTAIEGACVTTLEYAQDPESCKQRIRGAFEEMDPGDGLLWN